MINHAAEIIEQGRREKKRGVGGLYVPPWEVESLKAVCVKL